jgi:hypothetical protein
MVAGVYRRGLKTMRKLLVVKVSPAAGENLKGIAEAMGAAYDANVSDDENRRRVFDAIDIYNWRQRATVEPPGVNGEERN